MRNKPFVASQGQNSRDFRQPLDKEKDVIEKPPKVSNEYRSPAPTQSGKGPGGVIRY